MKRQRNVNLLLMLVLLVAVGQMAQTIYIPAIADMARDLNVREGAVQSVMGAYLLTYGVSQLFYGPISDCGKFASGLRHPCDYQMTQNLIGNPVEADAVIDLIKQKPSTVYQHVVNIAKETLCLLDFLSLAVIKVKFLLTAK